MKEGTVNDYALVLFNFKYLVNELIQDKISKKDIKDAIKAAVFMRAYLFAMPHMTYPEEMRTGFFESCYLLVSYVKKYLESKKNILEPETVFLLRTASVSITGVLSVWEQEELSHGTCICCGEKVPKIKFADCKVSEHTPKFVEEWDLPAVAKQMTLESRDNFSLYKKVKKLYGQYNCEACGTEQTLLDAYMNWRYANTQLEQPDEALLEWLYEKSEEIDKGYETREQVLCYRNFVIDYLKAKKKTDTVLKLKYFMGIQDIYKYKRETHGKELQYYTNACKEMVEELLADNSISEEERANCLVMQMDLQYDDTVGQILSEEKMQEMIAFYDKYLGIGNEKSNRCIVRMAISLAENPNNKTNQERGLNLLLQQLETLETHNPQAKEDISRIYELISYIYKKYIKNYQYAMIYYQPYLRYIEETYGKHSDYASDERRIFNEIKELYNKQKRKQEQQEKAEQKQMKLKRKRFSYDCDSEKNSEDMIEEILASKRLPNIEELVVGCWGECYEESAQAIIDGIVEHKEQFQHIKSLYIGDMEMEECEVSWILQGDYSKLWDALPNLEKLTIKGSSGLVLGSICHEKLKELEIICGGLPKAVIQSIAKAHLPELTSLNLYLGVRDYGFDGGIKDINKLLENTFPKLTKLGLVDSDMQDKIAEAVVKSSYMKQLTELSLSKGSLTDRGAAFLLEEVPKYPNLTVLDLEYHYMSCQMMIRLLELPIKVNVDGQQESEEYDGEVYNYPMLTE